MGKIIFIYAEDQNGIIGNQNKLPWYLPSELERFRNLTIGKTIVMGKNTFLSLPNGKPLPYRRNIIVSKSLVLTNSRQDGLVKVIPDLIYLKILQQEGNDLFIIGGCKLFESVINSFQVDIIYRTIVKVKSLGDTYAPYIDFDQYKVMTNAFYYDSNGYYINEQNEKINKKIKYQILVYHLNEVRKVKVIQQRIYSARMITKKSQLDIPPLDEPSIFCTNDSLMNFILNYKD